MRGQLLVAGVAASLYVSHAAAAQTAPSLGVAQSFAVLGGSSVVASGRSRFSGNVGVSPGKSISGITSDNLIVGDILVDDATARQAQRDSAAAYAKLAALSPCTQLIDPKPMPPPDNVDLGPGVYCVTSPISKTLTLMGDATAVWIFQVKGSLETLDGSSVLLRGGATYNNVFWQVDDSVTLGAHSAFVGTILASADITLKRDASVSGRLLSQTGVVTLDTDDVSCCDPIELVPASLPNGNVGKSYNQTIHTGMGGVAPYTFSLFDGALPAELTLAPGGTLSGTPVKGGQSTFTVLVVDAHGCSSIHTYTVIMICNTITVSLEPKADPQACALYKRRIIVTGAISPYKITAVGLPAGLSPLSLPPPDGDTISGMPLPSSPGNYTVTIDVTDALGCTGSLTFTLHVDCGLMLPPLNPSTATVGALYTANIAPSCGTGSFEYTTADFPLWLSRPTMEGKITGTPPAPVPALFTVTVVDSVTNCTDTRTYTLPVVCAQIGSPPPIVLPNGAVCKPYDFGPIAGTIVDPASLPPGLIVNGRLQGVPQKSGTFRFTMKLDNVSPAPPCPSPTQDYIITIECPPLALPPLAPLHGCVPTSQSLVPAFCLPFTWSYTGTLPNGLVFNDVGFSGILHGTPQPGDFDFIVVGVAGGSGCAATAHYTGSVTACVPPPCSSPITGLPPSSNLAGGTVGVSYNPGMTPTFTASGGTPPYKFAAVAPPGLGVSQSGVLSGTPTTSGRFNFSVRATDAKGASGCPVVYTIVIGPVSFPFDIPVLTPWVMLLLAMALAIVAVAVIRRSS
jgi:large repetitive protein